MKSFILAFIVVVALIVPARADNCRDNPDACRDGECCVKVDLVYQCRPFKQEGAMCTPSVVKSSGKVYRMRCPCGDGLTCNGDSERVSVMWPPFEKGQRGTCIAEK